MEVGERPAPEPSPGEVRVAIKAAALNRVDKWMRDGWPGLKLPLPHIDGSDGAGVVESLGAGVTRVKAGDRVVVDTSVGCGVCDACLAGHDNWCERWRLLGETVDGTNAEFLVVPERQLLRLPDSVSFEQAAAAGLVFLTAWHSLITRGGLRAGESVLIVGAGGGVNTASIQIAKYAGCQVYVVGSNGDKLEKARGLGADVLIDRSKEDWGKAVFQLTGRRGVDVVVDNVGAPTMMQSLRAARKGGRVLTVGNTGGPRFELDNRFMFSKHVSLIGSTMGTLADYKAVMDMVFAGRFNAPIDSTFPLADIQAAHARLEGSDVFGKIVLVL